MTLHLTRDKYPHGWLGTGASKAQVSRAHRIYLDGKLVKGVPA